ncbi:hypothetical protein A3F36_03915 [Candidatus Peribacteria bacterium RIFCSPHIGHO2_12_FULL_55_11]|nr:MAG: hypothetical protein A3F36_03915 [Candidatus Peribacteria bacterium RIFCSPHIGHO2_12_FULL_55_11]
MRITLFSIGIAMFFSYGYTRTYNYPRPAARPVSSSCAPIVCPNGKTFPTCTTRGYPMNYFVYPCRFQ